MKESMLGSCHLETARTQTNTHKLIIIQSLIDTQTHKYTNTHTYTQTHKHKNSQIQTNAQTHNHSISHTNTQTQPQTQTQTSSPMAEGGTLALLADWLDNKDGDHPPARGAAKDIHKFSKISTTDYLGLQMATCLDQLGRLYAIKGYYLYVCL